MRIEAIETSADRARLPERSVLVPAHITAAAQSLGISATQMAQAFSVGSSLSEVAQVRGISQEALLAAMEANPPASLALQETTKAARASTFARVAQAIDAIV